MGLLWLLACAGSGDDPGLDSGVDTGFPCDSPAVWYLDYDGDGYGGADWPLQSCSAPDAYVADASDCDDGDPATNPGAAELCDGLDQDCDAEVDEDAVDGLAWGGDADGDGYGDGAGTGSGCTVPDDGYTDFSDCDDSDAAISPDGAEQCGDHVDQDCDGADLACLTASLDLSAATASIVASGEGYLGIGLSWGDYDGDGADDVYAGAPYLTGSGQAFVARGPIVGEIGLADLDLRIIGGDTSEHFGMAMAGPDLDGDGLAELVVGDDADSLGADWGGAVYVFGSGLTGEWTAEDAEVVWYGTEEDGIAYEVASIGDTDGDGADDLAIGARLEDANGENAGRVYVTGSGGGGALADGATALVGAGRTATPASRWRPRGTSTGTAWRT